MRHLILVYIVALLTGCGGGGSAEPSADSAPGALSTDQRFAALAAVQARYAELKQAGGDGVNEAIAAYLRTRPEFNEVGVVAESSTVWATFVDGRELTIINNRPLMPGQAVAPLASRSHLLAGELPAGTKALVGNSFPTYGPAQAITADVAAYLKKDGFADVTTLPAMSVADLKNRADIGVLFLHGHSGPGKTGVFAMTTATVATASDDPDYADDIKNQRIRYAMADFPEGPGGTMVPSIHYSIMPAFVTTYLSFAKDSVVILHGCETGSPVARVFRDAFIGKHAAMVLGWDQDIDDTANEAIRYYLDRMIGADTATPKETPPQRPFDHAAVVDDMLRAGLLPARNVGPAKTTLSNLVATPAASSYALLAPTLRSMSVDERQKTLTLEGRFGLDPGPADGKVFIGGKEMTSRAWGGEQIVVNDLPATGAGAFGDVYVEVRKHKSNTVQLTYWKLRLTTLFNDFPPEPNDTLKEEGFIEIHFRADVHSFRDKPHDAPTDPVVAFQQTLDSFGQINASGVARDTKGEVLETWRGSSELKALGAAPGVKNILTSYGDIDVAHRRITLALLGEAIDGMFSTRPPEAETALPYITGRLDGDFGAADQTPALHLTLNDDFSIGAGVSNVLIGGLLWHIAWVKVDAVSPPDPKGAH